MTEEGLGIEASGCGNDGKSLVGTSLSGSLSDTTAKLCFMLIFASPLFGGLGSRVCLVELLVQVSVRFSASLFFLPASGV